LSSGVLSTLTWHTSLSWHTSHATWHTTWLSSGGLVDLHHDWVELGLDFLVFGFHLLGVGGFVSFEPLEGGGGKVFDGLLVLVRELVLELLLVEGVLHLEAVVLKLVLGLDLSLDLVVLVLVFLGVTHHLVDFLLGKSTLIVGDGNLVLLSSGLISSRDVKDTVGVNVEGDLNLWGSSWGWWDSLQVELSEDVVVLGHLSLSLEDLDEHTWLVVGVGGEDLRLLGWDGGLSWDQHSHHSSSGFDTLGESGNIEKEQVLDGFVSGSIEDGSLDGGTIGDGFVWVDGLVQSLSVEEVLKHLLDLWNSSGSSDENNFVDLSLSDSGVLEDGLYWWHALSEEIDTEILELGSGDGGVVVLTLGKSFALNWRLMGTGENSLGLLALGSQSSESSGVLGDVDSGLLLEVGHAVVDKLVVEIFSSQVSVTVGGLDLEDTLINGQKGDIKSTSTKIEDENVLLLLGFLVETVSNSSGGWLVDDSGNVKSSNGSGILGGLSLGVIEISWNSDDGVLDSLSEVRLSDFSHLDQNHGGDFFWLEFLLLSLEGDRDDWLLSVTLLDLEWPELDVSLDSVVRELSSDKSLGIEDGVSWVSGNLILGSVSNKSFFFSEGNIGWGGVKTLIVGDDFDLVVYPHSDAGVGGSEIDSDSVGGSHVFEF